MLLGIALILLGAVLFVRGFEEWKLNFWDYYLETDPKTLETIDMRATAMPERSG